MAIVKKISLLMIALLSLIYLLVYFNPKVYDVVSINIVKRFCAEGGTKITNCSALIQKPLAAKRIVFWNDAWSFILGDNQPDKKVECNVPCIVSVNRTDPLAHDALILHARAFSPHFWRYPPPKQRRPNQLYIAHIMESPVYRLNDFVKGSKVYNMTMTYHRKSEIWTPFFYFDNITGSPKDLDLPHGKYKRKPSDSVVFWVVGHCTAASRRMTYFNMLKLHIKVDVYGRCGKRCPEGKGRQCHENLIKSGQYKFYLAFENSACSDYVSEKVYEPSKWGAIPVVYGTQGPKDYKTLLPQHSFINIEDYQSPKELADYLSYLDKNETAYREYFEWRKYYEVKTYMDGFEKGLCQICNLLQDVENRPPQNVDFGEFWNPGKMCDSQRLEKILNRANNSSGKIL